MFETTSVDPVQMLTAAAVSSNGPEESVSLFFRTKTLDLTNYE